MHHPLGSFFCKFYFFPIEADEGKDASGYDNRNCGQIQILEYRISRPAQKIVLSRIIRHRWLNRRCRSHLFRLPNKPVLFSLFLKIVYAEHPGSPGRNKEEQEAVKYRQLAMVYDRQQCTGSMSHPIGPAVLTRKTGIFIPADGKSKSFCEPCHKKRNPTATRSRAYICVSYLDRNIFSPLWFEMPFNIFSVSYNKTLARIN